MKTELIRNFSTASLASLARADSSLTESGSSGFISGNEFPGFPDQDSKFNGVKAACSEAVNKLCSRKMMEKRFPFIRWMPEYTVDKLIADLIAGFTVGLTILPQGLAYATVGGLPPQYGLYSGFIGCFAYILLGGTAEVTIGPTAIMGIITYTYTRGRPPAYAVILCFLTGIVTMLMGVLQLGFIVNFISTPVNSGFTSAAALTICSTQIKGLLGLSFAAEGFLPVIRGTINNIMKVKLWDSIMSVICISVLLFLMKLQVIFAFIGKRSPVINKILWFVSTARNAILVIVSTAIVSSLGESQPFNVVGHITAGIPDFQVPPFNIFDPETNSTHTFGQVLKEEASAIIVVPLLAIMEHITIAKAFAGSKQIDASQEMLSIGVSNILGSFFSSMPITGSFSRTTVNAMSGAKSPMGGLVTGSMVLLALRFLTPYFYYIPKAALASVIVCAVIFMVDLDVIKPMWRSKKMDFIPWGLTFLVSLFVGLEFGMMTGFIISVIYLLYYAARPNVKVRRGYFADFTAAQGLQDLVKQFQKRDQLLIFWKAKPSLVRMLSGVNPDFTYCRSEEELENLIDSNCKKPGIDYKNSPPGQEEKFLTVPIN